MRRLAIVLALLPLPALTGCVERLLSVRSQPPGATVLLDGESVGETPCEVRYVWYGTRRVTLEKRGFISVSRDVELAAPWWQIFPLDFVTDVVIPFTLTDRTELVFLLQEEGKDSVNPDDVKKRADELRQKARE